MSEFVGRGPLEAVVLEAVVPWRLWSPGGCGPGGCGPLEAVVPWRLRSPGGCGPLEAVVLEAVVPWRLWSPGGCGPGGCGPLEAVVPWRLWSPGGCGPLEAVVLEAVVLEAVVLEAVVPWRLWSPGGYGPGGRGPGGCGPGGCGPGGRGPLEATVLEAVVPWRLWSPGGCGPLEATVLEAVFLEAVVLEPGSWRLGRVWELECENDYLYTINCSLRAPPPGLRPPNGSSWLNFISYDESEMRPGRCPLTHKENRSSCLCQNCTEETFGETPLKIYLCHEPCPTAACCEVLEENYYPQMNITPIAPSQPAVVTKSSRFIFSWSSSYEGYLPNFFLQDYLQYQLRLQREDQHQAPVTLSGMGRSLAVDVESLAAGGQYTARVRSSPAEGTDYRGKWSPWSQESRWWTPGGPPRGPPHRGRVWELECENDYLYTINCSLRAPPPGLRPPNGSSWLNFISYDESEMRPGRCPLMLKENRSSCLCQNCTEETFGETPLKIYLCHEPCPTAACCEVLEENYYPQMNITPIAPSQPAVVTKSSRFIFSWSSSYEGYLPNFFLQDYLQYQLRLQREDQHQAPVTLSGMGRSLAVDVESLAAGGQYTARVRSSPAEGRGPLEAVVLEAAVPWRLWSPGGCGPGGCGPLEAVVPWRLWSWRLRSPGGRGPLEAVVLEAAVPWRLWSPGGCGPLEAVVLEAVVPWRLWSPGGRGPGGCGPGGRGPLEAVVLWRLWSWRLRSPGGYGPGGWVLEAVVLEATALEAVVPWRLWSPGGCGPLEAVVLEATVLEAAVPWRPRSPGGRGPLEAVFLEAVVLEAVVLEAVVLEAGSWRLWSWRLRSWRPWSWRLWSWRLWSWRLRPWRPWSPGGCGPLEAVVPWRLWSWRLRSPGGCGPLEAVVPWRLRSWRLWSPGGCGPLEAVVLEAVVLEAVVPWRLWSWRLGPGGWVLEAGRPGRCPLMLKENRSSCLCQNCTEETFGETPLKIYLCHEPCPTAACCEVLEENYYPQINITPIAPSQPAVVTKSSRFIFSWSSSYEEYLPNFFLQDYLQYQLRSAAGGPAPGPCDPLWDGEELGGGRGESG
ncbi:unnamed protein product [Gadus morhua 'NCC']